MDLVEGYLQKLEEKIRHLAEDHQNIRTDKDLLIRQSVTHLNTIEEQKEEIESLKKQVQALKIAKSVESVKDTGKVKEKIQELVREIDRCIELLNK
jgi:nucleotide-binding universal stress UspA family protein